MAREKGKRRCVCLRWLELQWLQQASSLGREEIISTKYGTRRRCLQREIKKGFAVFFLKPQRVAWTLMTFVLRDWGNRAEKKFANSAAAAKNGILFSGNRCVRAETKKSIFSALPIWRLYIQHTTKNQDGGCPPPKKNFFSGSLFPLYKIRISREIHDEYFLFLCVGKHKKLPLSIFAQKGILQVDTAAAKAKSSPFTLPPLVCTT